MTIFASPRFLSRVMWADSASCAATGAVQVAFTESLAGLTGLPAGLLSGTGAFLLAYAALAAVLARRTPTPRTLIGLIAVGNLGWAVGCVGLLASDRVAPSGLGVAWVLAQAVTVVVLAELQWTGLRRSRARTGLHTADTLS